ncbi:MAG: acyltransferase [Planctomycetota bacterium]|jgi:phenylacetic acid degradation protein
MPVYEFEGIRPVVDPTAFVDDTAVLIGDVIVEAGCFIGPGAVLRGDIGRLVVKAGANIQDNCILHCFPGRDVVVETDGHIGHGAVLHGCTVARNAMVGIGAVVMDGAVVGEEAIVAAMAFVKAGDDVPPRTLVAGIPATVVRPLRDDEVDWKSQGTAIYQHLARRHLATSKVVEPLQHAEPDRRRVPDLGLAPKHEQP